MAEGTTPFVSVVIPTRNREVDLAETLEQLGRSDYERVEVLVCDDASDVDPRARLRERFPHVRVMRAARRVGPCELRNRLVAAARGEVIVGLDDDCCFERADALSTIAAVFAARPSLGLLSCRVRTPDGRLWPARCGEPMRESAWFIACAFAVRRAAYQAVGGMDPRIFRAGEERDLAIRLMDAGYEIRHADELVALHRESPADRDHQFIHGLALRNELLFAVQRVPWPFVPGRLMRHAASHAAFCATRGWWRALAQGLAGFVWRAPGALARRRAVSAATWRRFVALSREQFEIERPAAVVAATGP